MASGRGNSKDYDFKTLKADTLKELFVREIEAKIISGALKPGDGCF
jgi:DNA-binding GntR family transcriptional regulator